MKKDWNKLSKGDYKWQYCSLGGVARVTISSGEDIAHLGELDQKLWTVLSCPVSGLELDERTLDLIDYDRDGKIRVDEVVAASQWLCRLLRDPELILKGQDFISFDDINTEDEEGAKILLYAKHVLKTIGVEKETLSLSELQEFVKHVDSDCQKEFEERLAAILIPDAPYGASSDDAVAAVNAVRDKMADFFMRCKFARFHDGCSQALDISVERVAEISDKNLATCVEEISKYPISRPLATCVMPLNEGINPAWQAAFSKVRTLVLDVDYPDRESISEADWNAVVAKVDAYVAAKAEAARIETETFEARMKEARDAVQPLERLLHLCRDFYRLLRNYLMMSDFYDRNANAIFQAGRLYIDSRCLNMCMRVEDLAKHADVARMSGMFLLYCTCTSKVLNKSMNIVAALTDGDIDNLYVGKNALFYDSLGQDWDAVVTQLVNNPISVRQAFWMPYKKLWNWITAKINKSAAAKEEKAIAGLTEKSSAAASNLSATMAGQQVEKPKQQPFDIGKFAGIFAAIGLAFGFIAGALTSLGKVLFSSPLAFVLIILLVLVSISGPSVFIAWSKLRKRNLGPILNANGWAVNARISVNPRFGATLTDLASYPKIVLDDPYTKKRMPRWLNFCTNLLFVLLLIFGLLYFNGYFNRYDGLSTLHYDESSAVYRFNSKIFGNMKQELHEAADGIGEAVASPAAEVPTTPPTSETPALQ